MTQQQELNMNLSIFIPVVFIELTERHIKDIMSQENVGFVEQVDLIPKVNRHGKRYNSAYIHLIWCYSDINEQILEQLEKGESVRFNYNETSYWTFMKNTSSQKRQVLLTEEDYKNMDEFETECDAIEEVSFLKQQAEANSMSLVDVKYVICLEERIKELDSSIKLTYKLLTSMELDIIQKIENAKKEGNTELILQQLRSIIVEGRRTLIDSKEIIGYKQPYTKEELEENGGTR
jgi:hypothetical protein